MKCLKCNSEWSSTNYNKNTCPFCGELLDCDSISESDTIDELIKSAESGDPISQFNLGCAYFSEDNDSEAVKWFYKSAMQGNADAQLYMGLCFYYGSGVNSNKSEAVKWFYKSAKQGNAEAQYKMGSSFEYGKGVDKNFVEAAKWYSVSASQNNAKAQYSL